MQMKIEIFTNCKSLLGTVLLNLIPLQSVEIHMKKIESERTTLLRATDGMAKCGRRSARADSTYFLDLDPDPANARCAWDVPATMSCVHRCAEHRKLKYHIYYSGKVCVKRGDEFCDRIQAFRRNRAAKVEHLLQSQAMDKKQNTKDMGSLVYTDLYPFGKKDSEETTRLFLLRVFDILLDFIKKSNDRSCKILDFHQPNQLKEILDLDIPADPVNLETLLTDCKNALKYQVKTGHPYFFNQLSSGLDIVCMAGEWLTATANTNMFTYEIAPVFILMEQVVLKKMREIIGWTNGDSILGPGGSISNLYAALCARHKMYPTYKQQGLLGLGQLVIYTSEHSHYSMRGAGMVMGLGTDHVIEITCDNRGRMIPEELERRIRSDIDKGKKPFFVCCTSGTTVLGAFDPIHPLADICEKYGCWLHVDAAWGGGVLLSSTYRTRMNGVERAKSVTWNPHKLMGSLLQCSTVHFQEDGLLMSCNQLSADYLFQQDKHYDVNFDTGDKVIQCGRHNDIFKLWLMWRSKGERGYEKHIDHLFHMTEYMVKKLKERKDRFYLIIEEPECTNVSFWYIPKRLRSMPHSPQKEAILGELTATLKGRMMNIGTMMIGYQPIDCDSMKIPNFFRSIISNSAVQESDIDFMLDELDRLGHDL